jgi:hypothetical protein
MNNGDELNQRKLKIFNAKILNGVFRQRITKNYINLTMNYVIARG